MEISELTGLPELPAGHFWRVAKEQEFGLRLRFGGSSSQMAEISIVHRFEIRTHEDNEIMVLGLIPMVWGTKAVTKETENVIITGAITRVEERETQVFDANDDLIGVKFLPYDRPVSIDELTPEVILDAAKKVFERWKDRIKSNDLLGDYSPKKLNQENDK